MSADVEDEALALAEFGRRGLGEEERRAQVRADQVVELVRRDGTDRRRIERGRIVDEDVEPSEGADDCRDQRLAGGGFTRSAWKARAESARAALNSATRASASAFEPR